MLVQARSAEHDTAVANDETPTLRPDKRAHEGRLSGHFRRAWPKNEAGAAPDRDYSPAGTLYGIAPR